MEVILAEGTNILSKIIEKVTASNRSHCALRYSIPDNDWVVHSKMGGIQPEWWFYFDRQYQRRTRFKTSFSVADSALDVVIKKLAHENYDYGGLIGQGLSIIFGLKGNPFGNDNKYRCTELITEWHLECNKQDPKLNIKKFNSELVTPIDIENYYLTRPDLFQIIME